MGRIVVLSDIHLSPTHGFFWDNWCVAREFANAANADAVIVNGDLAINGPDSDAEMTFAAAALGKLHAGVVKALPGNHDAAGRPDPWVGAKRPWNPVRGCASLELEVRRRALWQLWTRGLMVWRISRAWFAAHELAAASS